MSSDKQRPPSNRSQAQSQDRSRISNPRSSALQNKSVDKSVINQSNVQQKQKNQILITILKSPIQKQLIAQSKSTLVARVKYNNLKQVILISQFERERVIELSSKLKSDIGQLLNHIDEIKKNQEEKRLQILKQRESQNDDQDILDLQNQRNAQEREIQNSKQHIDQLKRRLQKTYDVNKISEQENLRLQLINQLTLLVEEAESIKKIKNQQKCALNQLTNQQEDEKYLSEVTKMLHQSKENHRRLNEEYLRTEKELKKIRQNKIIKEKKIEELELKIHLSQKQPPLEITPEMIKQVEEEINDLEKQRKEHEKYKGDYIRELENEKSQQKELLEEKFIKLQNLEKESRRYKMIINEAQRYVRLEREESKSEKSRKPLLPPYQLAKKQPIQYPPIAKPERRSVSAMNRKDSEKSLLPLETIQPVAEKPNSGKSRQSATEKERERERENELQKERENELQKEKERANKQEKETETKQEEEKLEEEYDLDFDEEDVKTSKQSERLSQTIQIDDVQSEGGNIYSKPMKLIKKRK